ncbi:DUF5719 family protein [Arthrobacter sp. Br18]|uniref:DUF5719 family protein n=1 Tax=Arthrobacter sp. Br18 TaxID=1312954 RepID=UPI0004B1BB10|nr:DUF5719 family protein [Arthrobacter sp. Br18]
MSVPMPHPSTDTGRPRSRRARRSAGALAGALLLGATAALVALDAAGGSGAEPLEFPTPVAEVPAGNHTVVCTGPLRLPDSTVPDSTVPGGAFPGGDPAFSPVSSTARTLVSAMVLSDPGGSLPANALVPLGSGAPVPVPGEVPGTGSASAAAPVGSGNGAPRAAGVLRGSAVDAPAVFRADPGGAPAPVAGAMLTYTAGDGDLRGLATSTCQQPSNDVLLLGGATGVGDSSILVLTNPTETPAAVDLELFGAAGPVTAGTGSHLVPPGESRRVVLGGVAGSQEQLAVRVHSDGGRISAVVQQSVLRGLTPGGVELLAPSAPAAAAQVIPGVVIQAMDTAAAIRGQEGYAAASPALQVLVPGGSDAVLDVRIFGAGGEAPLPGGGVVTAAAGSVSTIPLDHLAEGSYTVSVTSDVPVAASARVSRGITAGAPVDFGNAPASERLGSGHAAVLADGTDVHFVFGAPEGGAEVTITPVGADGALRDPQLVDVAGGTSVTIPASSFGPDAAAVIVSAAGDPVFGAQVATLGGDTAGVSVTAIPDAAVSTRTIPVELRY